jgi:hypothetical protein
LSLCCFSQSEYATISIDKKQLVYNDHVGHEWTYDVQIRYNQKNYRLDDNDHITILLDGTNAKATIDLYVTEDDKYPDESFSSKEVSLLRSSTFIMSNVIQEGHGRFAGNTAKWEFTLSIMNSPNKPITTTTIPK